MAFDFLWTQVNELFIAGDYAGAERASRKAYYWSIVSIIMGLVSIVAVPVVIVSVSASANS